MSEENSPRTLEALPHVNPYVSPKTGAGETEHDEELDVAERVLWRRVRWARGLLFLVALVALLRIPNDPWNAGIVFVSIGVAYLVSRNAPLVGLAMGFSGLLPSWTLAFGTLAVQYDILLEFPLGILNDDYGSIFSSDSLLGIVTTFVVNAAFATVIWRAIAAAASLVGHEEGSWRRLRPGLLIGASLALLGVIEYLAQGWLGDYAETLEFAWAAAWVPVIWGARGEWLELLRGRRIKGTHLFYAGACLLALYAFTSQYVWFAFRVKLELPDHVGWLRERDFGDGVILAWLVAWRPLVEELVFRGFLQSRLERLMGPGQALVVQAALYSGVHGVEGALVSSAVLGLTLGWVRNRSRNLYAPLAVHVLYAAWVTLSGLGHLEGPLALDPW